MRGYNIYMQYFRKKTYRKKATDVLSAPGQSLKSYSEIDCVKFCFWIRRDCKEIRESYNGMPVSCDCSLFSAGIVFALV